MEELLNKIISQLDALNNKVDSLEHGQQEIKEELSNIKTEMRSSFKRLETNYTELKDVTELLSYRSIQQEKNVRDLQTSKNNN